MRGVFGVSHFGCKIKIAELKKLRKRDLEINSRSLF